MKQSEAKKLIREQWLLTVPMQKRTNANRLKFYNWLVENQPNLLAFQCAEPDKYHKVKAFLNDLTIEYNS